MIQPAPLSPASSAGIPSTPEVSQDEMRANIQDMMSKIDGKYQDFSSQNFSSDNSLQGQQGQLLRDFFDLLQSMGIDPSNPEEVKTFLDKIKEQNPELYQQIEQVLQTLLGEDASQDTEEFSPENMNMNIKENPTTQENI